MRIVFCFVLKALTWSYIIIKPITGKTINYNVIGRSNTFYYIEGREF